MRVAHGAPHFASVKPGGWLIFTLVAFLWVTFIGFDPFPYAAIRVQDIGESGGGDWMRQVSMTTVFLTFAIAVYKRFDNQTVMRTFSFTMWVLLGWCALSIFWSAVPFIVIRRLTLAFMVMFSFNAAVLIFGPKEFMRLIGYFLAACMIISVISVPFIPGAVHSYRDTGAADLIGNWRGVFIHKNTAGGVAAAYLVMCIYFLRNITERRWLWFLSVPAAITLLWFSQSKTSIALAVPSLAIGLGALMCLTSSSRKLMGNFLTLLFIVAATLPYFFAAEIAEVLEDPQAFTGRTVIWTALIDAIKAAPWLGWGFQSIWGVNVMSPMTNFSGHPWVWILAQGHNGYLDVAATLGIVGLVMMVMAFLIGPIREMLKNMAMPHDMAAAMVGVIAFISMENVTESTIMIPSHALSGVILIAISVGRYYEAVKQPPKREEVEHEKPLLARRRLGRR